MNKYHFFYTPGQLAKDMQLSSPEWTSSVDPDLPALPSTHSHPWRACTKLEVGLGRASAPYS